MSQRPDLIVVRSKQAKDMQSAIDKHLAGEAKKGWVAISLSVVLMGDGQAAWLLMQKAQG